MCFVCFICFICLWAGYGLPPRRGEEKPLQGTMAQRLTSAELPRRTASRQTRKDCAKQQFYAVFVFCCKKQGVATAGWVRLQLMDALQLPVGFRLQPAGCIATAGWIRLQPIDALQPPVVLRLQLMDALQPRVGFPLQPVDALQPWVMFGTFGKKRRDGQTIPSHFHPAFSHRRMRLCVRVRTP